MALSQGDLVLRYRELVARKEGSMDLLQRVSNNMDMFLASDVESMLFLGDDAISNNREMPTNEILHYQRQNQTEVLRLMEDIKSEFKKAAGALMRGLSKDARERARKDLYTRWAGQTMTRLMGILNAKGDLGIDVARMLDVEAGVQSGGDANMLRDESIRMARETITQIQTEAEAAMVSRDPVPDNVDDFLNEYHRFTNSATVRAFVAKVKHRLENQSTNRGTPLMVAISEGITQLLPTYLHDILAPERVGFLDRGAQVHHALDTLYSEFRRIATAYGNCMQFITNIQREVENIARDMRTAATETSEAVAVAMAFHRPVYNDLLVVSRNLLTLMIASQRRTDNDKATLARGMAELLHSQMFPGDILQDLQQTLQNDPSVFRARGRETLQDTYNYFLKEAQLSADQRAKGYLGLKWMGRIMEENRTLRSKFDEMSSKTAMILRHMNKIADAQGFDRKFLLRQLEEDGDLNRVSSGFLAKLAEEMQSEGLGHNRTRGKALQGKGRNATANDGKVDVLKGQSLILLPGYITEDLDVVFKLRGSDGHESLRDLMARPTPDFQFIDVFLDTQPLERLTHFLRLVVGKVNGNLVEAVDTQLLFGRSPMGVILSDEFNIRLGALDSIDEADLPPKDRRMLQALKEMRARAHIPGGMAEDMYYKCQVYWQSLLSRRTYFDRALEKFVYPSYDSCIRSVYSLLRGSHIYNRSDILIYDFICSDVAGPAFAALVANTLNYNANVNNVRATSSKSYTMDINNSEHQAYVNFFMTRCRPKPHFDTRRYSDRFESISQTRYPS